MASNIFEEELNCSLCCERFDPPKQLPCQHTYCLRCLERLANSRRILRCPECRQNHSVPENGVSGFPTNITMQRLLERANLANVPDQSSHRGDQDTTSVSENTSGGDRVRESQNTSGSNTTERVLISPTAPPFPENLNFMILNEELEDIQMRIALEENFENNREQDEATEVRQTGENDQENRNTRTGFFSKVRNIFHRFTGKILNDHKGVVIGVIIFFSVVTCSRFMAGAVKLSSECLLEKQVAVYLFVKACVAIIFWGVLVVWVFKSTLERALDNLCVQIYLVLESLFSLAWLCIGTIVVIGNFSSINEQCKEYKQWNKHFINFALFLTLVDYIGIVAFSFYSGYTLCDNEEEE